MSTPNKISPVRPPSSSRQARRLRRDRWKAPARSNTNLLRIEAIDGGIVVIGVAAIAGAPHRSESEALELAYRVASRPSAYLPLMLRLKMPGVTGLRTPLLRTAKGGGRAA